MYVVTVCLNGQGKQFLFIKQNEIFGFYELLFDQMSFLSKMPMYR